ncbi:MAG: hypothetical protein AAGG51_04925 [Cyanobacteria bacterium P01_G01_bin.54]
MFLFSSSPQAHGPRSTLQNQPINPYFRLLHQGLVLAIAIGITGNAVWRLIFSALGQPLAGTTGILVLVLHGVLMTTGLAALWLGRLPRVAYGLGSSLAGAVIGFFYGGSWFDESLLPAVMGALLLALVGDFLSWYGRQGRVAIALLGAIVTVSSATVFLLGTTAIAAIDAHHGFGMIFSVLTLLYLWLTWRWAVVLETHLRG